MKDCLNFGSVINAYVNNVFPNSEPIKQNDSLEEKDHLSETYDIPFIHKIIYTSFIFIILGILVSLCLITVNIKSVFMVNKSLTFAVNDIVSPNKEGFTHLIDKINDTKNPLVPDSAKESKSATSNIKSVTISLEHKDHIIYIDQIKTRSDIALWIQFGLIPSLFNGLNTFNRWVTNTLLIRFKGLDATYKVEIPNDTLSKTTMVLHSKPLVDSRVINGDSNVIQYLYKYDSDKSVNYQYIHGENIDDILSSLMQGTGYLNDEPYFPLNSIISNEKVNEISIDFLTNNKLSNVFSSVNVEFKVLETKTKVNGEEVGDTRIDHKMTISSYRINTSLFPLIFDGILILLFIASTSYTIVLYKLHTKSFFLFDYLFDSMFKISVFLSLVFFNAIVIFANYSLPRVANKSCDTAFCVSDVVLGYYDVKLDNEKLVNLSFDRLKFSIRVTVIVFGLLCFFVMFAVVTSLISTWLALNKNKQLSLKYKRYYYHLKIPILSLSIGIGISLFVIAIFNSSVAHMFKSSSHSVFHNFFALFNLILGISNEATLKYIDNYTIIYSIIFIMLLLVSFYLVIIVITSLLLMLDDNENSLNFYKRPVLWKYDNFRLIKFLYRTSKLYDTLKLFIRTKIFGMSSVHYAHMRAKLKSQPTQVVDDADVEDQDENERITKKLKFKFSFVHFFRILTYLIMVGCIFAFIYYEYNCTKVSKVISSTIDELIGRSKHKWNIELKFYAMKYSDLVKQPEFEPKDHRANITIESSLPNSKITTYPDLYYWLNIGSVRSLFNWIDTAGLSDLPQDKSTVVAINSRYYLHPNNLPILFSLYFYLTPPKYLVVNMKKVLFHERYYQLMKLDENTHGFKELFDNMVDTIPDTVKKLVIDLVVVDSRSQNKIYNARIKFYMEKSGVMAHEVNTYNVFSLFLPPKNRNIIYYLILGCTCVFFLILVGLMIKDIYNFRQGYFMFYPNSNSLHMIIMYFLNDIRRVFDFLIILFVASLLTLYILIFIHRRIILNHIQDFEDIYYRYYYQLLSKRMFYMHASIALLLAGIIVFGVVMKNATVRHYLYVGISVLYQMKYLYTNIVFYFIVLVFTYLFFFYFISKDYYTEFIKGNKFFKRCVRVLLYDHQFFGEFKEKSLTELVIYPLCLTFKIWLTNVIFYHLWAVWPKSDYSKPGTHSTEDDLFDEPDELEEKFKHSDLEVTNLTQLQLDALPKEDKSKAAQECMHLYSKFNEFNKSYDESGKSKEKYILELHDDLGDEMNDLLDVSNKLEFKVGIISKQIEILQTKSYKDLEEHISMLEETLSDKREELNAVFSVYNSKSKSQL